jgi:hypothetical protein
VLRRAGAAMYARTRPRACTVLDTRTGTAAAARISPRVVLGSARTQLDRSVLGCVRKFSRVSRLRSDIQYT